MFNKDDPIICEAIGDTYAGVIEHSLKKSNQEDAIVVIEGAFEKLFAMAASDDVTEQSASAECILRIIKAAPSAYFSSNALYIGKCILKLLTKKNLRITDSCLESLLSLILSNSKELLPLLDDILEILVQQVGNSAAIVRKMALDTIHTLCVVSADEMRFYKEEMLETINVVKHDSDNRVKEAAVEATAAIQALEGESTDDNIKPDSTMHMSSFNNATMHHPTSENKSTVMTGKDKKKVKTGQRRESSTLNKRNLNPNFLKTGISEIEIYFNDKKPITMINESATLEPTLTDRSQVKKTDRSESRNLEKSIPELEDPKKNNKILTQPLHISNPTNDSTQQEQPSYIPRMRPEDESNIFKDFEEERDLIKAVDYRQGGNPMDEERKRSPMARRQEDRLATERIRTNRSKTPEADFTQQLQLERLERRHQDFDQEVSEIRRPNIRGADSLHQKVVKTNDYEIRILRKTCEGLKKENDAQLNIIDFHTKRIDSLVSHVQNMTLHINHLLGKVNQLEQNMFQISNARPNSPHQIILPQFGYQPPSAPQKEVFPNYNMASQGGGGGQMGPVQFGYQQPNFQNQPSFGQPGTQMAQYGHVHQPPSTSYDRPAWQIDDSYKRDGDKHAGSGKKNNDRQMKADKWEAKRHKASDSEDEGYDRGHYKQKRNDSEDGRRANKKNNARETLDDRRKKYKSAWKDREESNTKPDISNRQSNFMVADSVDNRPSDNRHKSAEEANEDEELNKSETSEEDVDNEEFQVSNDEIENVLKKDQRKLLDYLADDSNLNKFDQLTKKTVRSLSDRLSELLKCRVESYIEIVVPWIIVCVDSKMLKGHNSSHVLSESLQVVLGAGKSSKQYSQELLKTLDSLRNSLLKQ